MKTRKGFVSNSSSSSFICEVCGGVESGYDQGLDELGLVECENNHIFHEEEVIGDYEPIEDEDEGTTRVPKDNCPICTMNTIRDKDVLAFMFEKYNTDRKTVEELMRTLKVKLK